MSVPVIILIVFAVLLFILSIILIIAKKKRASGKSTVNKTGTKKRSFEEGLHRTKLSFGDRILKAFSFKTDLEDIYDDLEEILVTGDVGIETALEIINKFKEKSEEEEINEETLLKENFKNVLKEIIPQVEFKLEENKLNVIFVFGVNGVGKTTSIGKLSYLFKQQGKKVLISACDTFRAAAGKQLAKWAYKVDVQIVKHSEGGSPGAVLYDAIDAALARNIDVLIVDTAGRFHNRQNLMQELEKLNKIIVKKIPDAVKRNFIVLDAGTGHNAYVQAKEFQDIVEVDGIILAKLDSSAKGGIVLPISHKLKIPVLFVGIGEKMEDLLKFNRDNFVESLF